MSAVKQLHADVVDELVGALDYLLEQSVDASLAAGFELTEGEQEARKRAIAAISAYYRR